MNELESDIRKGISLGVYLVLTYLFSLWTERSLNYALTAFNDYTVYVPYWVALLLQVLFTPLAIAFNIITEIVRFLN